MNLQPLPERNLAELLQEADSPADWKVSGTPEELVLFTQFLHNVSSGRYESNPIGINELGHLVLRITINSENNNSIYPPLSSSKV